MIIKKVFNPTKVIKYVQWEMAFATTITLLVYCLHQYNWIQLSTPFAVTPILGSALAIFIGFRNNNSYNRWWEARTQWAGIVNASRTFTRLIICFADSHAQEPTYQKERSFSFKQQMGYLLIALAYTTHFSLRKQHRYHELITYMSAKEFEAFSEAENKINHLLLLMGQKIYEAMGNKTLGGFDSFQLEGQLLALTNSIGACERIKETPMLRQYHYFTQLFLYLFILLMPFSLISDFLKTSQPIIFIPVVSMIAFVFSILSKVGQVNEDPFENQITDVPLTAICNTIERDVKEMLGEKELPLKATAEKGYLF